MKLKDAIAKVLENGEDSFYLSEHFQKEPYTRKVTIEKIDEYLENRQNHNLCGIIENQNYTIAYVDFQNGYRGLIISTVKCHFDAWHLVIDEPMNHKK